MKTKDFESVKEAKRAAIAQLAFYNEMMKVKMSKENIKLSISEEQFLVIYEFLYNMKLGNGNQFESAISDLMADFDNDVTRFIVNTCEANHGKPRVSAVMDEDGFCFQVSN